MKNSMVTAFCPGHISGFFRPLLTGDPGTSGSTGAGVVIDSGVTVTARAGTCSEVTVYRDESPEGKLVLVSNDSPVIIRLLGNLGVTAHIETRCRLPLSSGYGLSAAALLATAHAVNQLYELSLSDRECAYHAHMVEVAFRTGLGDVSACQGGGWVYRPIPGIDAAIRRFPDHRIITALTLGPLKTVSVLSSEEAMKRVYDAYPEGEPETLDDLFTFSRRFAEEAGLISEETRKVLIACDANHIPASMTMLGNGVFTLGGRAEDLLKQFGTPWRLHIAETGPKILEILS